MASKTLFKSFTGLFTGLPIANAVNEAGGSAYQLLPKATLAQFAATGCLSDTFYASAEEQLATVLALCNSRDVEPEFIARTALYARNKGHMKDLPALLCATLTVWGPGLLAEVFDRVIDDGRMLRNFVQIVRSGVVGRKSLGSLPKRLVQSWFEKRSDDQIFRASVGNDPSLADVIKMVHPKPATASRAALYGYLIGQPHKIDDLPPLVKAFEAFKKGESTQLPDIPFQLLTSLKLSSENWKEIAKNASWQTTRMNLNTFARHKVYEDKEMTRLIYNRLRDKALIQKARVFPYQLMVAFKQTGTQVPEPVRDALQDAMEIATGNVPALAAGVFVLPDVSGSMQSSVTGVRKGATSAVRCIDVAALVAATVLRTNPTATVMPFSDDFIDVRLNGRDSVMTNAQRLAALPSGGTNCSAPLRELNRRGAKGDLVIYVSDNESWIDSRGTGPWGGIGIGRATETMKQWDAFKQRNPAAKLVCIDVQPHRTTQATGRPDVLNIGGFSDSVFDVTAQFAAGTLGTGQWVSVIEAERI